MIRVIGELERIDGENRQPRPYAWYESLFWGAHRVADCGSHNRGHVEFGGCGSHAISKAGLTPPGGRVAGCLDHGLAGITGKHSEQDETRQGLKSDCAKLPPCLGLSQLP